MSLFKRFANTFDKHGVPIENDGGLPDPSEYTDGTVLIKVGNEWKAQSGYGYESDGAVHTIDQKFIPQSGVDEFMVTFEVDTTIGEITSDKTPEEITTALNSGRKISGELYAVYDGAKMFTAELHTSVEDGGKFYSSPKFNTTSNKLSIYVIKLNNNNNWTINQYSYTLTPDE